MKNLKLVFFAFLFMGFGALHAQEAQVNQINLTQQKGIFTTESLTVEAGAHQFNIHNDNVGHEVGFVLVPKGMYDADKHIKEAYVKAPVATGSSSMTSVVDLAPGEYEFFCPMNKTPKYTLTVTDKMMDKDAGMKKEGTKKMMEGTKKKKKGEKMMKEGEKMKEAKMMKEEGKG